MRPKDPGKTARMRRELREELKGKKTVVTIYIILRVLVILTMVAQFLNGNFENVFLCILTLVLFTLPTVIERRVRIDLPDTLEIIILLFIFSAEILGEIQAYYTYFHGWDTMLHTLNGFLCAAIGFSLVDLFNRNERFSLSLSPVFMAIVAFCFSMTIGVLWEFFECIMDSFFLLDMQKDTIVHSIGSVMLDPAGGSGGFATAAFRYKRRKAIDGTKPGSPQRERRLGLCKNSVFLVEISKRLVKIAKTAMLLTGDGNTGMTQGNSLDKYSNLDGWITSHCPKGTPDIIITNPPFSGQKTESMMMDPDILKLFGFGHRPDPEGTFPTITDDDDRDAGHGTLLIRQAPELLFLERCIDWLKPGGRIGIVLPKGILDNRTYINYRRWMLSRCKVDAVVTLHKNTFEPDTGVRTCVLFLSKPLEDDPVPGDYTIFMAQSRRVGKDSKGEPVFALDEKGSATSELDEDLTQIAESYKTFRDIGTFTESETCFTAERGELDDNLNLNPQHYSPELNATLEKVSKFDDKPDWSVTTIGQLDKNIRIYMGPRWSSRSLVVEDPSDTTNLTPYLTANGALEQRRMTVKWFDMSRATDKQKECVRMLRVQKGDILISRSGTIGKVTYATRILADKYVISDDLVRVRVPDENMRAYLLAFLMSSTAMNLMKLDEFGSVQQHLQPRHIWGLPVPVPDSWEQVSPIIDAGKGMISAMEQTSLADESLRTNGFDSLIE